MMQELLKLVGKHSKPSALQTSLPALAAAWMDVFSNTHSRSSIPSTRLHSLHPYSVQDQTQILSSQDYLPHCPPSSLSQSSSFSSHGFRGTGGAWLHQQPSLPSSAPFLPAACSTFAASAVLQPGSHSSWLQPHIATFHQINLNIECQGQTWTGLGGARRYNSNLSRKRVPKSAAINDNIMPNTTDLKYGMYGLRAVTGKRVTAATIEAVRRTLVRRIKRTARLWVRIQATVPVTKKSLGVRMGKGKGAIEYYACAVRPGQVVFEMDRVPRKIALSALEAVQPKFPCRLVFVDYS